MLTIPQIVNQYVRQNPYLEEAIGINIVNLSSLARYIKPDIEKKINRRIKNGAIIMALKRFSHELQDRQNPAKKILSQLSDITVRSNLIEYTFANSQTLSQKNSQLLNQAGRKKNAFITITHGIFETTILGSVAIASELKKIFEQEEIISQLEDLSSITIMLPAESIKTPGVHYLILRQLAWENISIIESISTYTEFTIVIENVQVDRAFSVLSRTLGKI